LAVYQLLMLGNLEATIVLATDPIMMCQEG